MSFLDLGRAAHLIFAAAPFGVQVNEQNPHELATPSGALTRSTFPAWYIQADRTRRHLGNQRTPVAIQETTAQHEVLEPAPGRGEPNSAAPTALALGEHLPGGECGIALDIGLVFLEGMNSVVQQVAGESPGLAVKSERFVNDAGESRCVAAVQAPLRIGIPPGMLDPSSQIPGFAGHFVDVALGLTCLPVQKRGVKQAAQLLVGIHRENPIVGGALGRKILLLGVV